MSHLTRQSPRPDPVAGRGLERVAVGGRGVAYGGHGPPDLTKTYAAPAFGKFEALVRQSERFWEIR